MTDEKKIIDEMGVDEGEQTLDTLKDLERIEQEAVAEATASVEDADKAGDIDAAAAAAETALEFEEAQEATENLL